MADTQNPLWQYALQVYARDQVKEACLSLQDEAGVDVILLLAAAYLGHCGRRLSEVELQQLTAAGAVPRESCVAVLRQLRRQVAEEVGSAGQQRCYNALKEAELAAEHWQVELITAEIAGWGVSPADTVADRATIISANMALFVPRCHSSRARAALGQFERAVV
ncbi:MAG: TIGR02444 family protein [Spongiibacter sp.]|nr:TIGR02444 family protein [Spongiibacter sp.]